MHCNNYIFWQDFLISLLLFLRFRLLKLVALVTSLHPPSTRERWQNWFVKFDEKILPKSFWLSVSLSILGHQLRCQCSWNKRLKVKPKTYKDVLLVVIEQRIFNGIPATPVRLFFGFSFLPYDKTVNESQFFAANAAKAALGIVFPPFHLKFRALDHSSFGFLWDSLEFFKIS